MNLCGVNVERGRVAMVSYSSGGVLGMVLSRDGVFGTEISIAHNVDSPPIRLSLVYSGTVFFCQRRKRDNYAPNHVWESIKHKKVELREQSKGDCVSNQLCH